MHPYEIPIWKQAPFLRISFPFILGILIQHYFPACQLLILIFGILTLSGLLIFSRLSAFVRFRFALVEGLLFNLLLFFFAAWIVHLKDIRHRTNWYGYHVNKESTCLLTIKQPPIEKLNSFKTIAKVEAIRIRDSTINTKGEVLVYFKKSEIASTLKFGDQILVRALPQDIRNFGNPGEFDNKHYWQFQQVYQQFYLDDAHYKKINTHSVPSLFAIIYFLRDEVLNVLRNHIPQANGQLGIAEALLIGYRDDLDVDLLNAYANTGVVHIIAISGLHLGLIYTVLVWLLSVIPFLKKYKITQAAMVILFLWTFSLMTGASASVMRSAVMFTVIIIGKTIHRNASIYNSLAASAFLLLCYDPYYLWDLGFQLSYLAIIGIVSLQQPIQRIWIPENKWIAKVWAMIAVTLAAQVFTFPVCIFYFHQFPVYFLPVNLLAVPISTIILFAEIILLPFSALPVMAHALGIAIGKGILMMNGIVEGFNQLPFSQISQIFANGASTICLYLFIILMMIAILYKNSKVVFSSLMALLSFNLILLSGHHQIRTQKRIIVYNIPHHFSMDIIAGSNYINICDSALANNPKLEDFYLKSSRRFQNLNPMPMKTFQFDTINCMIRFGQEKIIVLSANPDKRQNSIPTDSIIAVLHGNFNFDINLLLNLTRPSKMVFAANSLWKIAKWKSACEAVALPNFSVPEKGAFVIE